MALVVACSDGDDGPTGTFFDELLEVTWLTEDGPWAAAELGLGNDAIFVTSSRFWMDGEDLMADTLWRVHAPGSSGLEAGAFFCDYKSHVTFAPIDGADAATRLHVVEHVYEDNCGWDLADTELDLLHEVVSRDASGGDIRSPHPG